MARPNLFIIGAAKSGTTSLHWSLHKHPDVFMSRVKEPGFFVPEFRYWPKEESWYLDLFREAGNARYAGESSTHYTKIPLFNGVPARLRTYAPDARLIYVMRDPIKRAISHYWHNTLSTKPEFMERRPMLQAIREDQLYRDYGDYLMQLTPWLEHFDSSRILTLVYEEMVAEPAATLERVFGWLDLPPLATDLDHRNARPEKVFRARGFGLLQRFRRTRIWDRLSPLVPKPIKERGRSMAEREWSPGFADESEAVIELLRPWARERIGALSAFMNRDFPWQTSLSEAGPATAPQSSQ